MGSHGASRCQSANLMCMATIPHLEGGIPMTFRFAGPLSALLLFSSHLAAQEAVPTAPSIVSVQPDDSRVFVCDRLSDGTLTDPTALVARGVNWSPHSVCTPPEDLHLEFARWYPIDIRSEEHTSELQSPD